MVDFSTDSFYSDVMIRKGLFRILFILIIVSAVSLLFVKTSFAQEIASSSAKISSYELFWPITAGVVNGERQYSLKKLKENLISFLKFGTYKKAEYNLSLSEKRLVESEKLLLEKKDLKNSISSLEEAEIDRKKVIAALSEINNDSQKYELNRITIDSFKRQKMLLNYLETQASGQAQELLSKEANTLNSFLTELSP